MGYHLFLLFLHQNTILIMEKERLFTMINEAEGRSAVSFPALMRKVYLWMAMALAITGVTAFGVANNEALLTLIFGNPFVFWGLFIAEFALVMILSARIQRMSLTTATLMFIVYSILNGSVLSIVLLAYTQSSVASTFFICGGTFGAMALYGYTTKSDLSGMGKMAYMALFGLILATLVNIFIKSAGFSLILSYIGVLVFVGLTAWDTQKIKLMLAQAPADENGQKLAVLSALTLYLDFINLFLYLLRIFGGRKD